MPPRRPLPDRLLAKRVIDQVTDCWLWQGARNSEGYGNIGLGIGKLTGRVHRVAYQLFVGEIPDGLVLDHLCKVRNCFNPAHLEPVTQKENLRRSDTVTTLNRIKTACLRGHPYDAQNTILRVTKSGELGRKCRTCKQDFDRRRYARLKDAA